MSTDISPAVNSPPLMPGVSKETQVLGDRRPRANAQEPAKAQVETATSALELQKAASSVQNIVSEVSDTNLSFSVEDELSRMVVAVRAVGSDEIIRQFPPEEFLTVAKFIAAQNPDSIDEDFLKGILFDQYS